MDLISTGIVIVLGKYALDKGTELAKEVGPTALEKAKEMFGMALDKLRKDPKGEVIAEGYESDPETYAKPMEKELAKAITADAEFAAALKKLMAEYEAEAKKYAEAHGTTYTATAGDGSTIVQGNDNVVATGGSFANKGDVSGDIHIG